jgi:hypothetical protein
MNANTFSNIYFSRKPYSLSDVHEQARYELEEGRAEQVRVELKKELSSREYDAFTESLLASHDWMAGKGGSKNGLRSVIVITAPKRSTLFVDPSGGDYARYVGIEIV